MQIEVEKSYPRRSLSGLKDIQDVAFIRVGICPGDVRAWHVYPLRVTEPVSGSYLQRTILGNCMEELSGITRT